MYEYVAEVPEWSSRQDRIGRPTSSRVHLRLIKSVLEPKPEILPLPVTKEIPANVVAAPSAAEPETDERVSQIVLVPFTMPDLPEERAPAWRIPSHVLGRYVHFLLGFPGGLRRYIERAIAREQSVMGGRIRPNKELLREQARKHLADTLNGLLDDGHWLSERSRRGYLVCRVSIIQQGRRKDFFCLLDEEERRVVALNSAAQFRRSRKRQTHGSHAYAQRTRPRHR